MDKIEFAIRELAVAINYLMDVVGDDPFAYEHIPASLHHAVMELMREISAVDWESV